MKTARLGLAVMLALLVPACGGGSKKSTTIINNSITNPSPFTVLGSSSGGATGSNESGGVADLGTDSQPRSLFLFTAPGGGPSQIRFSRRNADGTWTAVLPISANDTDLKVSITVYVTPNNNFVHVFWLEGPTTVTYQLHYAQINNDPVPAIVVSDTIVSQGPSTNVGLGAAYNRVDVYTTVFDAGTNNIYAMWIQRILDGGNESAVPVVASILAGAGILQERFALVSPTGVGSDYGGQSPVLRVASNGRVHAAWASSDLVFHRLRTALATWSSGPSGDQVSSVIASLGIFKLELLLASDGDAYAAWINPSSQLRAAYRPAGDASVFAADVGVAGATTALKLAAVLEPGTEHLHLFVGAIAPSLPANVITHRNPAANLGGAWETETVDSVASTTDQSMDFAAWADATNRVVVAYQLPTMPNELSIIRARVRPTGAGNGNYAPAVNLTATGALPCDDLVVGKDSSGNAILAWSQGEHHTLPLSEIIGVEYRSGGTFGSSFNVSQTPATGSHGPIVAVLKNGGTGYFSWEEWISGSDGHDVYFALKP